MLDGNLKAYLESSAAKYAEPVRTLASVASVCQGEYDYQLEEVSRSVYTAARAAVASWLKDVLLVSVMGSSIESVAAAELALPSGYICVSVNSDDRSDTSPGSDIFGRGMPDPFASAGNVIERMPKTNLGRMSLPVYELITSIRDNPVALMYKYFDSQLELLHRFCGTGLLTDDVLSGHNVQDYLGIYDMDILYRSIKTTFNM